MGEANQIEFLRAEIKRVIDSCYHNGTVTLRAKEVLIKALSLEEDAKRHKSFPLQCVEHIAYRCSCDCRKNGMDIDSNSHYYNCIIGKAQQYLGIRVTEKRSQY